MHKMVPNYDQTLCCFERLTFVSVLFTLFPFVRRKRPEQISVYYIDASIVGRILARLLGIFFTFSLKQLSFRFKDIRNPDGSLSFLHLRYDLFFTVQNRVLQKALFIDLFGRRQEYGRLGSFLQKQIATFVNTDSKTLIRSLFLIIIAQWKAKRGGYGECLLFIEKRPWMAEIQRFGREKEVAVFQTKNITIETSFVKNIKNLFSPRVVFTCKHLYYSFSFHGMWRTICSFVGKSVSVLFQKTTPGKTAPGSMKSPTIGLQYYGNFNPDNPEKHSDLFFLQQSSLSAADITMSFNFSIDPIDAEKYDWISASGLNAVALAPNASRVKRVPFFSYAPSLCYGFNEPQFDFKGMSATERKWIRKNSQQYQLEKQYLEAFLSANGIRIFLSWIKYDGYHCIMSDALEIVDGVMAIYQRSFEEFSTAESMLDCHLVFGFSPWNAEIEEGHGSTIPYHVSVGYLGDHRFRLNQSRASQVRTALQKRGARNVVAYFDENTMPGGRWVAGHADMQAEYEFILKKVVDDKAFGLVLKPKNSATLRHRLGPVADLLESAIKTGRCLVFGNGKAQNTYPPAVAAMASDIAIHGHLSSATAGVESALAGVPTLLIDSDGWNVSRLYELEKGKVVFNDWQTLWDAVADYSRDDNPIPDIGDWSNLLGNIDPFRDGQAAGRMGNYLKAILDGFKDGQSRETVMNDVAEKYCEKWGHDKVRSINCA